MAIMPDDKRLEKILKEIKEKNLTVVRFEQADTNGIARSKLVPVYNFKERATKGITFGLSTLGADVFGGDVANTGYGSEIGYADGVYYPLLDTFTVLPWLKRTGRVLLEPKRNGQLVAGYPRVVARRQLEKLKGMGLSLFTAHEYEFYLADKNTMKPVNSDVNGCATLRCTLIYDFLQELMEYLPQVGITLENVETEHGPGQLEVTYKPAFGIRAADNAHTYKTSIKEIALLNGYVASFMSKPYPGKCGSSSHLCHSLWDADEQIPLLYDATNPLQLSEIGQHWIAGILAHAPAIQVLLAPTANCMKRVVKGLRCPVNATWGFGNHTCYLRVKLDGPEGTYLENRAGAAAGNPYLSLAAVAAAGMDGIVSKLKLPPECTGDAYIDDELPLNTLSLPSNMEDALIALTNDAVICDALGNEFIKAFTAIKKHEVTLQAEADERCDNDWEFDHSFYYL